MMHGEGRGWFLFEHVTVIRGAVTLLAEISANIPGGRCTAAMGASGAGKSTLLRLLNRLTEPTSGRVLLDGAPIADLDVLELRVIGASVDLVEVAQ